MSKLSKSDTEKISRIRAKINQLEGKLDSVDYDDEAKMDRIHNQIADLEGDIDDIESGDGSVGETDFESDTYSSRFYSAPNYTPVYRDKCDNEASIGKWAFVIFCILIVSIVGGVLYFKWASIWENYGRQIIIISILCTIGALDFIRNSIRIK